ncbi:MAG: sigma 54-interacting transcriptional regulator, partial [Planctomycetota bacterium]|nr:sigma 54-interacting transcriptional regulator [Planctomycetota bacterium]
AEYAKSDASIVITGETGTGKELFAQGIHNASRRADGMFVAINCAALPSGLLESELFGYSPGAFTGALRSGKAGLFEIAHQGTLFLDEISEMELFLQTRLLRAIQEGEIMRLGDSRIIPVDVRIIAAANKDLNEETERGNLREDLFFRLNVLSLPLPPLRARHGEIALLFRHHLARHAAKMGVPARIPGAAFFRDLERYPWPGNVRELENVAERYVVLQDRPESAELRRLLPRLERGNRSGTDVIARKQSGNGGADESGEAGESLNAVIRQTITKTLAAENGNIVRASRRLGVNRNTIKRWMKKAEE